MNNQLYNLKKSDFKLFKDFALSWRFTEPDYNLLPKNIVNKIQPINEKKTSQLYKEIVFQYWHNYSLQKNKADIVAQIDIEHLSEIEVKKWLQDKFTDTKCKIVIYWIHCGGADESVITECPSHTTHGVRIAYRAVRLIKAGDELQGERVPTFDENTHSAKRLSPTWSCSCAMLPCGHCPQERPGNEISPASAAPGSRSAGSSTVSRESPGAAA